ncbi:hypothetical protein [Kurthia massiliensis]|uniref:hypothetical protein n=1 Tax=Kurthia massiliensis TaxID=1033739 RepID=UPI000289C11A|nr:hypothetical protein [Kurthia massiliensis]
MICGTCACKKEKVLTSKVFQMAKGQLMIGDIPATFCECGVHVSHSVEMELDEYIKDQESKVSGMVACSYNDL